MPTHRCVNDYYYSFKHSPLLCRLVVRVRLISTVGVDPPDSVPKPTARARLEAWIDPYSCSPQKAAYKIATSLQKSYERWQPRARFALC